MAEQLTYSIRDLEALSGVPAHTIRTWERRYRLISPARSFCNARCYTAGDISFLQQLASLLKQGHRISTLAGKSREEIALLAKESALATNESELSETLCLALQDLDAFKVESLMNCYIRKEGFDKAVVARFIPFLNQVNVLLLSGVLQQIHVQIFYSTLRQKVHAALDSVMPSREGERWILIQDSEALDAIYRDIMHYLLRKRGNQVIVAGVTSPAVMESLVKDVRPEGFCLVAGGENAGVWLQNVLMIIPSTLVNQGKALVLAPGKTLEFVNNSLIDDVTVLPGLQEAFTYMTTV